MPTRPRSILALLCGTALGLCTSLASRATAHLTTEHALLGEPDADALIKLLRDALTGDSADKRRAMVVGLSALRDPALRPLMAQLSTSPWADVRIQAILALAQMQPSHGVDLLMVQRLTDTQEQGALISAAVRRDLLLPGQLEDLARWDTLSDEVAVYVAGLLTSEGTPPAPQRLRKIAATHKDPEVRLHAALVLKQQGDDTITPTIDAMLSQLLERPSTAASRSVSEAMWRIRRQRLSSAADFCRAVREKFASDPLVRYEALATLLAIAPDDPRTIEATTAAWALGETPADQLAERNRVAIAMLDAALDRPARLTPLIPLFDQVQDPTLSAVGRVLKALAAGEANASEQIAALATYQHPPLTSWALRSAKQRPWQEAKIVRLAIVRAARIQDGATSSQSSIQAATEIADSDPDILRPVLDEARASGQTAVVRAILAGGLQSMDAKAGGLATLPKGQTEWPDPASAALADLLSARHPPTSPPRDVAATDALVARIYKIAQGTASPLPPVYSLQAAWLALKAADQDRAALARLISASATASPAKVGP